MQFASSEIDRIVYNATELPISIPSDTNLGVTTYGPFYRTKIKESIVFGENVRLITEFLFQSAVMDIAEVTINAERIGAYAFAGSEISIGLVTLGEDVRYLEECSDHKATEYIWCQFQGAAIGSLRMNSTDLRLGHSKEAYAGFKIYGPFYQATVENLEIDSGVTRIPEAFLYQASLSQDALSVGAATIEAYAFAGNGIHIGRLTMESSVEVLEESYFSTSAQHYYYQFYNAGIDFYCYHAPKLAMGHEMGTSLTNTVYGPFWGAKLGGLEIGENVEVIPEYFLDHAAAALGNMTIKARKIGGYAFGGGDISFDVLTIGEGVFYNSTISEEELILNMPVIGAYAFAGANIHIGTLTVGSGVKSFSLAPDSTSAYYRWQQFYSATIGELRYEASSAETVGLAGDDHYCYGPFASCKVGRLVLGASLQKIPAYCFAGMVLDQEELEIHVPVIASGAFSGANMQIGTLTLGEEVEEFLYVGNSLLYFKQFYQARIGTLKLLSPHIKTTTGSCYKGPFEECTINGLEIGEQVDVISDYRELEILNQCTVCGYEIREAGELDETHEVYLSLPVGVDLTYDSVARQYLGASEVFAYGRLGNAYSGINYGPLEKKRRAAGLFILSFALLPVLVHFIYQPVGQSLLAWLAAVGSDRVTQENVGQFIDFIRWGVNAMKLTNEVMDIMRRLDPSTYNHCYRMWWIAGEQEAVFGRKDDSYSTAAFIHDIGKFYVPVRILDKREGLTPLEREIVELHPYFGYRLLDAAGVDERVKRLVLYHHGMEPRMLTVLPEFDSASVEEDANMLRTLDVFEALTSDRPYKRRKSVEETCFLMKAEGGFHKDTLEYLRENVADF